MKECLPLEKWLIIASSRLVFKFSHFTKVEMRALHSRIISDVYRKARRLKELLHKLTKVLKLFRRSNTSSKLSTKGARDESWTNCNCENSFSTEICEPGMANNTFATVYNSGNFSLVFSHHFQISSLNLSSSGENDLNRYSNSDELFDVTNPILRRLSRKYFSYFRSTASSASVSAAELSLVSSTLLDETHFVNAVKTRQGYYEYRLVLR